MWSWVGPGAKQRRATERRWRNVGCRPRVALSRIHIIYVCVERKPFREDKRHGIRSAFTYLRYIVGDIFIRNSTQKIRENYCHTHSITSIIHCYSVLYIYTYISLLETKITFMFVSDTFYVFWRSLLLSLFGQRLWTVRRCEVNLIFQIDYILC